MEDVPEIITPILQLKAKQRGQSPERLGNLSTNSVDPKSNVLTGTRGFETSSFSLSGKSKTVLS